MQNSIPIIRQKKGSVDCGLACVAMALKYYKINKTIDDLRKEIKIYKVGTYAPQLGAYLIKQGLTVEIKTLNPWIFTLSHKNKKININHFKKLLKIKKSKINKRTIQYFIDFIKAGGIVTPEIPSVKNIKNEVQNKNLLIVLTTTNYLTGKKPKYNFHFNVITGIDKKYIYCNDPHWNNSGGKKKFLIDEYIFGIHASSYGDADNGCLIITKKYGK